MNFKHLASITSPGRPARAGRWLFVLMSVFSGSLQAGMQYFGATVTDSHWQVSTSALRCELRHVIPLYGEARFVERAGGKGLEFSVSVRRRPLHKAEAKLTAEPPSWQHSLPPRELGALPVRPTLTPFRLSQVRARRLLAELRAGMFPTLRYADWSDGEDQVRVAISAVNLRPALDEFQACTRQLLPYDFEDVRRIRVHFATDKSALDRKAQAQLARLARYLAADKSINVVDIRGYTDSIGPRRYNRELSRRRAEAARTFLVSKGVDAKRISLRYFGERHPVRSNATAAGRALNRRVVVLVEK